MKAYAFEKNNIPVVLMKPATDTRDGWGIIKSRVGLEHECYMIEGPTWNIWQTYCKDYADKHNHTWPKWILVDEAQFLDPIYVECLSQIVDDFNINVICYGLRSDFQGKLFPGSKRLFELADSIDELKLTCKCGRKAIINARVDLNGEVIPIGPQVSLGGDDKYVSMCRKCYNESLNKVLDPDDPYEPKYNEKQAKEIKKIVAEQQRELDELCKDQTEDSPWM
jgi:thymidine kinase